MTHIFVGGIQRVACLYMVLLFTILTLLISLLSFRIKSFLSAVLFSGQELPCLCLVLMNSDLIFPVQSAQGNSHDWGTWL